MPDVALGDAAVRRWWRDDGLIDRVISGVFEGGGAKGVLYAGALEAMADERCWFDAVAGASAGAITAMLAAAGMRPGQVRDQMEAALSTLRSPNALNGISRVREGASYLDQGSLLDWLRRVLEDQFGSIAGIAGGGGATFGDLFDLTGIELNVVAVDLSRHGLVVFNYQLTPACQVAEAVVASAAIPFAFEGLRLRIPGRPVGVIVDGGVAANFPSFVFTDGSFRRWAGLPDRPASSIVVGFLLEVDAESSPDKPAVYREAVFGPQLSSVSGRRFRPKRMARPTRLPSRVGSAVRIPIRVVLWPFKQFFFSWFPAFLAWNGGETHMGKAAWPAPKGRIVRGGLRWLDQILTGIRPYGVLLGGLAAVSLFLGAGLFTYGLEPLFQHGRDIAQGRVGFIRAVSGIILYVGLIAAAVYAWIVLVVLFLAASVGHASARAIGYGLAKTFLQGPGAPPWAGEAEGDHVVRLRVPNGITTLELRLREAEVGAAIECARNDARTELCRILKTFPIDLAAAPGLAEADAPRP